MGNLQEGFFRLTIVVSVITGLLFLDVPGFEDSYSDEAWYFRQGLYYKLAQEYKTGEAYYTDVNSGEVFTYESHPRYFDKHHYGRTYRQAPLKWFQKVFVFFKVVLFALLGAMPYAMAVWVIYFTIRFIVMGFIRK